MYYNDFKEVAKKPALLASLAGFISPTMIIPAIAFGVVLLALKSNKNLKTKQEELQADKKRLTNYSETLEDELEEYYGKEDEAEEDSTVDKPLNNSISTVNPTAPEPLNSTVSNGYYNGHSNSSTTVETLSDEQLKKEMLRQTMSELGKRSAIARARKKAKRTC